MREYMIALREQHGQTKLEVATALGISEGYYFQIEQGLRQQNMDPMLIAELAVHYCLPIARIARQEQEWRSRNVPDAGTVHV